MAGKTGFGFILGCLGLDIDFAEFMWYCFELHSYRSELIRSVSNHEMR